MKIFQVDIFELPVRRVPAVPILLGPTSVPRQQLPLTWRNTSLFLCADWMQCDMKEKNAPRSAAKSCRAPITRPNTGPRYSSEQYGIHLRCIQPPLAKTILRYHGIYRRPRFALLAKRTDGSHRTFPLPPSTLPHRQYGHSRPRTAGR